MDGSGLGAVIRGAEVDFSYPEECLSRPPGFRECIHELRQGLGGSMRSAGADSSSGRNHSIPTQFMKKVLLVLLCRSLVVGWLSWSATGCSTTQSSAAKPVKQASLKTLDLRRFESVTVVPFTSPANKSIDPKVGENFAADIAARLRNDFGTLFREVKLGQPLSQPEELVIRGEVSKYIPGSPAARMILIGLGSAHFEATVRLADGGSGQELLAAPIDKLWAWGGVLGASKDIERMMAESAASVAATVAQGKGWAPAPKK